MGAAYCGVFYARCLVTLASISRVMCAVIVALFLFFVNAKTARVTNDDFKSRRHEAA